MKRTKPSSNRYPNINDRTTRIPSIPHSLNISLQPQSNQFNITVYKTGNGQYSLEKPVLTSTFPQQIPKSSSLRFKNKNWVSKLRSQDKGVRNAKNIRNMCKDLIDGISYSVYQELEAGPSILPKKKYCDFTGFETNYTELNTGIKYYNAKIFQLFQNMAQPVKDQYLNIRKALIRLK